MATQGERQIWEQLLCLGLNPRSSIHQLATRHDKTLTLEILFPLCEVTMYNTWMLPSVQLLAQDLAKKKNMSAYGAYSNIHTPN